MFARMLSLFRDEAGNSVIEYALIVSLIAVTGMFGLSLLGTNMQTKLNSASTSITAAVSPGAP